MLVDTYGHPVSLMNGTMESLTATRYRMAQYDTFRDPEKCLVLAEMIMMVTMERIRTTGATEPNSGVVELDVEFCANEVPLFVRLPVGARLRSGGGTPSNELAFVELSIGNVPKSVELISGKALKSVELSGGARSEVFPRS